MVRLKIGRIWGQLRRLFCRNLTQKTDSIYLKETLNCSGFHLYSCSMVAGLNAENLTNMIKDDEYVDIRNEQTELLKEKLKHYLYETTYLNSCRYCNGMYAGAKEVIKGLQTKRN